MTDDASYIPGQTPPDAEKASVKQRRELDRRAFLIGASGVAVASAGLGAPVLAQTSKPNAQDAVTLPQLHAPTEAPEKTPGPFENREQRTGFAVIGLGTLALNQILPAFAKSKYAKPVALVSGDREKARKIAEQYGIAQEGIYDYAGYERLADNKQVQAIYIVLPNSMHAEYTVRGAKMGKHIFCEKPMATSVADCEHMIAACNSAKVKLMIAYRQQYEPMNRAIVKMVKEGKLGRIKSFVASNSQNQGDPNQWRQKIKLAGGGCLPDVGIYCLNAARFLTGEEPNEVQGSIYQPKDDPRFVEVEETASFLVRFPSGLIATCSSGYGAHRSQFLRVEGELGWAELSRAFGYHGIRLRYSRHEAPSDITVEPSIEEKDQFALELDHMALCVQQDRAPHTPGEEGLQDQRIVEAIYDSAKSGRPVKIRLPPQPTRGPEPEEG